ncbi:hypothetical protein LGH83_05255 [Lichenihabitans sp. PAMC28606]|uniref:hypothetical protein n=1 Tax=Lichenihabitans sp. PAMC28606 TaxID=2880932 RepID=UPI001D0B4C6C|nr:hypothetical protein [Lichenihabitans sp. PAMC28606]UDL95627.1 hypothetical protein LGH83_05255 [Lichenihabitans sp. PAMC28606]
MLTIARHGTASIAIGTSADALPSEDDLESPAFLGAAVHRAIQHPDKIATYTRWATGAAGSAFDGRLTRSMVRITDVRSHAAPLMHDGVVTIAEDVTVALIVDMEVDPARAEALLNELNVSTDTFLPAFPAVRSVSFHRGTNGSRIVEYLQVESAEAMMAIQARPDMQEHERRVAELARSLTADLYRVDRIVLPTSS